MNLEDDMLRHQRANTWFHLCEVASIGAFTEAERRMVAAVKGEGWWLGGIGS